MESCSCGMHFCGKCSAFMLVFGIVFLLVGAKYVMVDPWIVVGAFFALAGLGAMFMKGKK